MSGVVLPGVTQAFPNWVMAHFGHGSEGILMEVLTKKPCQNRVFQWCLSRSQFATLKINIIHKRLSQF